MNAGEAPTDRHVVAAKPVLARLRPAPERTTTR